MLRPSKESDRPKANSTQAPSAPLLSIFPGRKSYPTIKQSKDLKENGHKQDIFVLQVKEMAGSHK